MDGTVCRKCGESTDRNADFCAGCGAFLEWNAVDGDEDAPPVGVATYPKQPTPAVTATASQGSAGTAPTAESVSVDAPVSLGASTAPEARGCRRCGAGNPPERRFCRKCALEFDPPAAAGWTPRTGQLRHPWWRRWFGGHRTPEERRALKAYRRSLPLRFRVFRALVAVLIAGLVAGAVWAVRGDPIRWTQARWDDVHDTTEPLQGVTVTLDPAGEPAQTDFEPAFAVDGQLATAWATSWSTGEPPPSCSGQQRTKARLLLTFPGGVADIRELQIVAGLPQDDAARPDQHRPARLEVRSSNGTCQLIDLADVAAMQRVPLNPPVSTDMLLLDVVEVYPSETGRSDLVAISEIVPMRRPAH